MEINIFDPQYVEKQRIASLQRMAAEQNSLRVQRYQGQSQNWIEVNVRNRDLQVPISPLPEVPKKVVITDSGEWTEVPFTDLVPPVLPPQTVSVSSPIRAAIPAVDRLDQVIAALDMMNQKLDKLLSK